MTRKANQTDIERTLSKAPASDRPTLLDLYRQAGEVEESTADDAPNLEAVFDRISKSIDSESSDLDSPPHRSGIRRILLHPTWLIRIAAVILVLAVIGVLARPVHIRTDPGEQIQTTLPDGSIVNLNSDSRLTYFRWGWQERAVRLDGEAFFDVLTEYRPFVVRTHNARIEVVGTRFNVVGRSGSLNSATRLYVEEGSVRFEARQTSGSIQLSQHQQSAVLPGATTPTEPGTLDLSGGPSWLEGDLVFSNVPYGEALEEAERRLGIRIDLEATGMSSRRISAAFRAPISPRTVLEGLCHPFGLQFRSVAGGYEIIDPDKP